MVKPLGKKVRRIAWGITGSADQMIETYSVLVHIKEQTGTVKALAPNGKIIDLTMRKVDVENSEKLAAMENITVLESAYDIYDIVGLERPAENISQKYV